MPGVPAIGDWSREFQLLQIGKGLLVKSCLARTAVDKTFQLPELMNANSGLNVAEVVLEPVVHHFVIPIAFFVITIPSILTDPMEGEHPHAVQQSLIRSSNHPTFAGRQILGGIEAKSNRVTS